MSFQNFRVKIVSFRHIKMGYNIFVRFIFKHSSVKNNIMIILVIFFIFKMINYC